MGLDLRFPIGALFLIIGLLLAGFGWTTSGVDIDRWWGLVMAAFGALMLTLSRRSRRSGV